MNKMLSNNSAAPKLEALRYSRGNFQLLNQLKLPQVFEYDNVTTAEEGFEAIRSMRVRGAPAIAIAAALSLAVEIHSRAAEFSSTASLANVLLDKLDYLAQSRPTAVNLFEAVSRLKKIIRDGNAELPNNLAGTQELLERFLVAAESMLASDVSDNRAIGKYGAEALLKSAFVKQQSSKSSALENSSHNAQAAPAGLKILTHCNTGSLATAAFGTALGIIRALREQGNLSHAYATETRPYNQGARLTAFELVYEKIPSTLITDSMAAFLMSQKGIDGVVVGADRVVANGDTANKIGTYQLAIVAKHHNVPFYVAAPSTSIDCSLAHGGLIHIEERPKHELTHLNGIQIAAEGIDVWNPSFDVTPAALITGIVTEVGVIEKDPQTQQFAVEKFLQQHNRVRSTNHA